MEPVLDPAEQAQIIARAHRIGRIGAVRVEILAMKGTAEEELLAVNREYGEWCSLPKASLARSRLPNASLARSRLPNASLVP